MSALLKHRFTITLTNVTDIDANLEKCVFGFGCDDGLLYRQERQVQVKFTRLAESCSQAIV